MKRALRGALLAFGLCLAAAGSLPGAGVAFAEGPVLGDFEIPSQQPSRARALRRVSDSGSVRIATDPQLGTVVIASGTQDAINAAIEHLGSRPGAVFISTDAGLGVVGVGGGTNASVDAANPVIAAEGARLAGLEATLDARRRIADLMGRLDRGGREAIAAQASALDGRAAEPGDAMRRMLRGAVVYDTLESGPGEHRVAMVSTPRSEGRVQFLSATAITSWSMEAGLTAVFAQIGADAAPAAGAWIIGVAPTGEVAWVAYGSSIIRPHDDPGVQRQLRDEAFRTAEQRARRAMVQILQGEAIEAPENAGARARRIEREADTLLDPDSGSARSMGAIASRIASVTINEDKIRSITRGALPPGVQLRTYTSADGMWAQAVCVLTVRSEDAARRMSGAAGGAPLGSPARLGDPLRTGDSGRLMLNDLGEPVPAR